jgi:hypothetical protein
MSTCCVRPCWTEKKERNRTEAANRKGDWIGCAIDWCVRAPCPRTYRNLSLSDADPGRPEHNLPPPHTHTPTPPVARGGPCSLHELDMHVVASRAEASELRPCRHGVFAELPQPVAASPSPVIKRQEGHARPHSGLGLVD